MNDQTPVQQLLAKQIDALAEEVREMNAVLARNFVNGEIATFTFGGPDEVATVLDDRGSDALAYGVYNATDLAIGIRTAGVVVPVWPMKAIVVPLTINGHVELVSFEAPGEKSQAVLRWRFPTPQPFFLEDIG